VLSGLTAVVMSLAISSGTFAQSQSPAAQSASSPVPVQSPVPQGQLVVSVNSLSASFFANPTDSAAFISSPSTTVNFTQTFPALNFNAPPGTVTCNPPVNVSADTRPFTDVVPQPDGSCKTIPVQSANLQAGVGDLSSFQAVLTASFQVAAASRVTFSIWSDDGWILSIGPNGSGAQPGYVSGPMLNFPRVGPFTGYPIVGSYNVSSAPNRTDLVVGFPAAGTYPFELDYSECCDGTLALTMFANGAPIPPASALALNVTGVTDGATVQGKQHIDVTATAGQAQQVEFLVDGKSQGVVKAPPFGFDWDTSQVPAGQHTLVFRATDSSGGAVDKQLTVRTGPAVAAAASPVASAVPTAIPAASTTIPAQNNNTNTILIIAAAVLVLLALIGAGLYFFLVYRKTQKPKPVPVVAAPEPVIVAPAEEHTEFIGRVPLTDMTMVSNRRPQLLPKAKLLVRPDREIPLNRATETVIGRDANNAAFIDDRQVSRHHARISVIDGDFWIEDLNSTNGTRVNGATINKQKLANNDQINVGDTIMTFALES